MIAAIDFLNECKNRGFNLFTGTPCSYLKPFINFVIDDNDLDFVPMTNEGDAVAFASGAWLAGKKSVVMFQNSGLGNAVNPLTSLNAIFNIPVLGIVTLRGEPGGPKDEPQHALMGTITTSLLEQMQIPWRYFPQEVNEVESALNYAQDVMASSSRPFFFVMQKDSVEAYELKQVENTKSEKLNTEIISHVSGDNQSNRTDALTIIRDSLGPECALVATTGKTGRELYEIEDSKNQIYMVGSMGCASSLGLGISYVAKDKKVCVIDGDGALMMRMGNLTSGGLLGGNNFIHILLDNAVHDSTGGQKSFSEKVNFSLIAKACGYKHIYETNSASELELILKNSKQASGPTFIHFYIKSGSPKNLGRPGKTPDEVGLRFKQYLAQ